MNRIRFLAWLAGLFFFFLEIPVIFAWGPVDSKSSARIDVHLGGLSPLEAEIALDRIAWAKESLELKFRTDVQFKVYPTSTTDDLIASITSPDTLGVLWIGHPALLIERGEEPEILDSFLKTASGRYLPKAILSASGPQLQFVGIVSCHGQDWRNRYKQSSETRPIPLLFPQSGHINPLARQNPFFELVSLISGPVEVLQQIHENLDTYLSLFKQARSERTVIDPHFLRVEYRDLLSAHYDYEVLLDGKLVGTLNPQTDETDLKRNRASKKLQVPDEFLIGRHEWVIRPDDAGRRLPRGEAQVIDDILVDRITLLNASGETLFTLLEQTVHVGDDARNWDRSTGLAFRSNYPDFQSNPPVPELRLWQSR